MRQYRETDLLNLTHLRSGPTVPEACRRKLAAYRRTGKLCCLRQAAGLCTPENRRKVMDALQLAVIDGHLCMVDTMIKL